jgi:hypothetical protein
MLYRRAGGILALLLIPTLLSSRRPGDSAGEERPAPEAGADQTAGHPAAQGAEPGALRAFLASGTYESWSHRTTRHPGQAPHLDQVQVFLNPTLGESVAARKPIHPQGAAAVLAMSDAEGRPWGWAVAVKVNASSGGGRGWYWYSVRSTADAGLTPTADYLVPEQPDAAGLGLGQCLTCHLKGHDYIITRSLD